MWKVNAGRRSALADEFIDRGVVAIGWSEIGDYSNCTSFEQVMDIVSRAYPDRTDRQKQVSANQIWRFLNELKVGDEVITYARTERLYHLGKIASDPIYAPDEIELLPVQRKVDWESTVSRDDLSDAAKGRLGAILTLFKVASSAADELRQLATGGIPSIAQPEPNEDILDDTADPFEGMEDQSIERIKDKLLRLDWEEMQEIIAALLRSLGYRTMVSTVGPDRGKDIIASKDGFGFERPRIVVEVKHRPRQQMGAQEIRSFLGGRHQDDRGLYVSTGGFSKDARYEAERASTVTHLMTLDELARAIIAQYDTLDEQGKRLLPLVKIYWPA